MRVIEFLDTTLGWWTDAWCEFSIKEKWPLPSSWRNGDFCHWAGFDQSLILFEAVRQIAWLWPRRLWQVWLSQSSQTLMLVMRLLKMPSIRRFMFSLRPVPFTVNLNFKSQRRNFDANHWTCQLCPWAFWGGEFSRQDTTRTELEYLLEVVQTAVDAGAIHQHSRYSRLYDSSALRRNFPLLDNKHQVGPWIIFSPHCHNDLGMAVANTLSAIKNGAGRVGELSTVSVSEQKSRPLKK